MLSINSFLLQFAAETTDAGSNYFRIALGLDPGGHMVFSIILVLVGMLLITKGGDIFTDSAVAIATATRIPPVIIGATIVSMATTFPEFVVSLTGALSGNPGFAVGNALGSCCCNIGLIVGTCALLDGFLAKRRGEEPGIPASRVILLGPGAFMVTAGLATWVFGFFEPGGAISNEQSAAYGIARWQAILLVILLVAYLAYSLRSALQARFETALDPAEDEAEEKMGEQILKQLGMFLVGGVLVILGSKLLVTNAEQIAIAAGVPKLIIGLTVLAVGTSLPEYTISLLAVIKGHGSLGIGNIMGANVLNICWVVATCALINPIPIERQTILLDGPIVLTLMVCMLAFAWKKERISATSGAMLFAIYLIYLGLMFTLFV